MIKLTRKDKQVIKYYNWDKVITKITMDQYFKFEHWIHNTNYLFVFYKYLYLEIEKLRKKIENYTFEEKLEFKTDPELALRKLVDAFIELRKRPLREFCDEKTDDIENNFKWPKYLERY